jgi:hypothetical protein
MPGIFEPFRTLYCDPGEDFGWCVGRGTKLLGAGTHKMWEFADEVYDSILGREFTGMLNDVDLAGYGREGIERSEVGVRKEHGPDALRIGRIVYEDFRLYPWVLRAGGLDWNPVRTARVIGALTLIARRAGIPLIAQPAAIKKAAKAAGAEELYYHPLHENRHQNDAIQHFVFYTNTELMGLHMPVPKDDDA